MINFVGEIVIICRKKHINPIKNMKKIVFLSAAVITALTLSSCKTSKESAYRKAYEKAQAQQQVVEQQPQVEQQATAVVTPLVEKPATASTASVDNETVRQENLTVVNGAGLKAYSVVVGSFGVKANAEGLQRTLNNAGNQAQVAYNSERNMYRVIIGTYASKADAVAKRNEVRSKYADAWLLFNK